MREPPVDLPQSILGVHSRDRPRVALHADATRARLEITERQPVERPHVLLVDVRRPAKLRRHGERGERVGKRRVHGSNRRPREFPESRVSLERARRLSGLATPRADFASNSAGERMIMYASAHTEGRLSYRSPRWIPPPREPPAELDENLLAYLRVHGRPGDVHHRTSLRAALGVVTLEQPSHHLGTLRRLGSVGAWWKILLQSSTKRERAPRLELRAERRRVAIRGGGANVRTLGRARRTRLGRTSLLRRRRRRRRVRLGVGLPLGLRRFLLVRRRPRRPRGRLGDHRVEHGRRDVHEFGRPLTRRVAQRVGQMHEASLSERRVSLPILLVHRIRKRRLRRAGPRRVRHDPPIRLARRPKSLRWESWVVRGGGVRARDGAGGGGGGIVPRFVRDVSDPERLCERGAERGASVCRVELGIRLEEDEGLRGVPSGAEFHLRARAKRQETVAERRSRARARLRRDANQRRQLGKLRRRRASRPGPTDSEASPPRTNPGGPASRSPSRRQRGDASRSASAVLSYAHKMSVGANRRTVASSGAHGSTRGRRGSEGSASSSAKCASQPTSTSRAPRWRHSSAV